MFKSFYFLASVGLVALGAVLVGCSKESAPAPPAVVKEEPVKEVEAPAADATAASEKNTTADSGTASDSGAVTGMLASLSEADRAAVLAQKICPVSGEALGAMGTPFKVTIKGREVFLCCPNCREKIEANPDEYLAKLDAK